MILPIASTKYNTKFFSEGGIWTFLGSFKSSSSVNGLLYNSKPYKGIGCSYGFINNSVVVFPLKYGYGYDGT